MAMELDEEKDLPSSEQADLDEDQISDLADDAGSSAATDEDPKDTLSIVRDVVAPTEAAAPEEPGSSPDGEDATATAAEKTPDNDNFTDVPFHKHPRFQYLLREKKAAEEDATRYRNVESFLERSNLSADEAADALNTFALAKADPVKAWEQIKPWVEKLAVSAGVIMPPDLQQMVQNGQMTREAAIEVSKARAQVQSVQTREQLYQQQAERRAQVEAQNTLMSAVASWEQDRQAKDPNFAAKMPALQREIAYIHATEGRPKTPEIARDQCERAYKAVNSAFRAPQAPAPVQRKPATRPVTGGQVAGNAAAEPKSTLDIIRAHRRSG